MKKYLLCLSVIAILFTGCKTNVDCNCEHEIVVKTTGTGSSGTSGSSNSIYPGVKDSDPRPGKIYYSDGTVSEYYDSSKTPVGLVLSLNKDGTVDYIMSLTSSTTAVDASTGKELANAYDAGCGFNAGKWILPTPALGMKEYDGITYIQNGFSNLIASGYRGNLSRPRNANYRTTVIQSGSTVYYNYNPITGAIAYNTADHLAVFFLKITYPTE